MRARHLPGGLYRCCVSSHMRESADGNEDISILSFNASHKTSRTPSSPRADLSKSPYRYRLKDIDSQWRGVDRRPWSRVHLDPSFIETGTLMKTCSSAKRFFRELGPRNKPRRRNGEYDRRYKEALRQVKAYLVALEKSRFEGSGLGAAATRAGRYLTHLRQGWGGPGGETRTGTPEPSAPLRSEPRLCESRWPPAVAKMHSC